VVEHIVLLCVQVFFYVHVFLKHFFITHAIYSFIHTPNKGLLFHHMQI